MTKKLFLIFFFVLFNISWAKENFVDVIQIEGVIDSVVARYLIRGIDRAEQDGAECLVIQMDTPGGLDTSMREMVQRMLNSKVPLVVYVSPRGARAASAGVFITIAGHLSAMASGTNIGAAHPVALGGDEKMSDTMSEKVANDAAAYIKSIADKRKRNVFWAEKAVRKSSSITAKEALKLKIIDFVVDDLKTLLKKIDGKEVETASGKKILYTKNAKINYYKMTAPESFLHTISHPNIAYILLIIAIYGLIYELANPGAVLPGVVGGISLILALFSLASLPINYAAVLFILFGIILFIVEVKVPGFGLPTLGGIISFGLGSAMLIDSPAPYLRISPGLIFTMTLITALFFIFIVGYVVKTLRKQVSTGKEGLVGNCGIAKTEVFKSGTVFISGAYWSAESLGEVIKEGEKVEIVSSDGLKLKVKKVD